MLAVAAALDEIDGLVKTAWLVKDRLVEAASLVEASVPLDKVVLDARTVAVLVSSTVITVVPKDVVVAAVVLV